MSQWYCKIAQQEIGPIPSAELKRLAMNGQLLPHDYVRRADMAKWTTADHVQGLFDGRKIPQVLGQGSNNANSSVADARESAEPVRRAGPSKAVIVSGLIASGICAAVIVFATTRLQEEPPKRLMPETTSASTQAANNSTKSFETTNNGRVLETTTPAPALASNETVDLTPKEPGTKSAEVPESNAVMPTSKPVAEVKPTTVSQDVAKLDPASTSEFKSLPPAADGAKKSVQPGRFPAIDSLESFQQLRSNPPPNPLKGGLINCKVWNAAEKDSSSLLDQNLDDSTPPIFAGIQANAGFSALIAKARAEFFAKYPDKPGFAEARAKFSDYLWQKDLIYLYLWLGPAEGRTQRSLYERERLAKPYELLTGGKVDGGIPPPAKVAFADWANALIKNGNFDLKDDPDALMHYFRASPEQVISAIVKSKPQYDKYTFTRDWAEFDKAGIEPIGFDAPELNWAMLATRFQDLPWDEAVYQGQCMMALLGEEPVGRAIQKIRAAPKDKLGMLANPEAIGVIPQQHTFKGGPGHEEEVEDRNVQAPEGLVCVLGGYEPITAVVALAAHDEAKRYLFSLLAPMPLQRKTPWKTELARQKVDSSDVHGGLFDWEAAFISYRRFVAAFGEPAVLAAAEAVRIAPKRLSSSGVFEPGAIGAKHGRPFDAIIDILAIKNPKAYVKLMLSFRDNLEDSQAMDDAYSEFIKPLNEDAICNAAVYLELEKSFPFVDTDLERVKKTATKPLKVVALEPRVDNPEYLRWKRFAPGTTVRYIARGWTEIYGKKKPVGDAEGTRSDLRLKSIDAEKAVVEIVKGGAEAERPGRSPSETLTIRAKCAQSVRDALEKENVKRGKETITIDSQPIACEWSTTSKEVSNDKAVAKLKIWWSDDVPGGIVKKTEESSTHIQQLPGAPLAKAYAEQTLISFTGIPRDTTESSNGEAAQAVSAK